MPETDTDGVVPSPASQVLRLLRPEPEPTPGPPQPEDLHFDTIFTQYAPYVANVALRILGRESEVDDVVQDVFVSVFRNLEQVRDAGAIKGWLATITVRTASRRLRKRRLKEMIGVSRDVASYNNLASSDATPEQRAVLNAVYRALDRLPARERLPWTLRYVEGEQLARVAELCGCSLATAKRRISAAHAKIKEACDAQG